MVYQLTEENLYKNKNEIVDLLLYTDDGAMGCPGLVLLLLDSGDLYIANALKKYSNSNVNKISEIVKVLNLHDTSKYDEFYIGCGNYSIINLDYKYLIDSFLDENRYCFTLNHITEKSKTSMKDIYTMFSNIE